MEINLRTLVLDQSFMPHSVFPLSVVLAREAICGYLSGKVDVVYWYDRPILTPSRRDLHWPSVIVTKHAKKFINKVRLTKEALYYRDNTRCFWCDMPLTKQKHQRNTMTDDHVVPLSKGGKTEWTNLVASCPECNRMKGSSMPVGRWQPKKKIFEPSFFQMIEIRAKYPMVIDDPNWAQFLPAFSTNNLIIDKHRKGTNDNADRISTAQAV